MEREAEEGTHLHCCIKPPRMLVWEDGEQRDMPGEKYQRSRQRIEKHVWRSGNTENFFEAPENRCLKPPGMLVREDADSALQRDVLCLEKSTQASNAFRTVYVDQMMWGIMCNGRITSGLGESKPLAPNCIIWHTKAPNSVPYLTSSHVPRCTKAHKHTGNTMQEPYLFLFLPPPFPTVNRLAVSASTCSFASLLKPFLQTGPRPSPS